MKIGIWGLAATVCAVGWAQGRGDRAAVPRRGEGEIRPHSWIRGSGPGGNERPQASTGPGFLFPSDITTAYGITPSMGGGSGVTIAIVDAYDAPNIAADLAVFSKQFSLPACGSGCFSKVSETGTSTLPAANSGWEVETSLDVEWVHAIAPNAHILLVEAKSDNTNDLLTAVNYAKAHASVVSMSWGGNESRGEAGSDGAFLQSGVTFLASSGDTGGLVEWPSSSPYVIAVGGTNLGVSKGHLASPIAETAWSGSGGGCSLYEAKIAAQSGFVPSSCKTRAVPDVSMDGGSPVSVYVSDQGGWFGVYGTSLSVQLYAGLIGTVNGMRGPHTLVSALSDLYAAAAGASTSSLYLSDFRDVTSGTAGHFSAGAGWDFTTGLGSPLAGALAPFLVTKQ